jgi:hypothetical protein
MTREILVALGILGLLAACINGSERVATKNGQSSASSSVVGMPGAAVVVLDKPEVSGETEDVYEGPVIFSREWDPGRTDESHPHTRFLAREHPIANRALLLFLDTAITPVGKPDALTAYAPADSVLVPGIGRDELFTAHCYLRGSVLVGQIGGVSSRGTPEHFEHPRLAWRFDTLTKRIQSMDADSVYCTISEPD